MGLRLFGSSSSGDKKKSTSMFSHWLSESKGSIPIDNKNFIPNPDPTNYKIVKHIYINNILLVMINYLDCTNYEGNKILLFENCTIEQLIAQKYIDPHFCDNDEFLSPIARYEPTERGWLMAMHSAIGFSQKKK